MVPTLRDGDLLEFAACRLEELLIGDVLLFLSPADHRWIVHRVTAILASGVRTRGDGNDGEDPFVLRDGIVGRVVAAWRGGVRRRVGGGLAGRAWIGMLRVALPRARTAARLFLPRRLLASTLAGVWAHVRRDPLRPRVVAFRANDAVRSRIMVGRWIVAERDPGAARWQVRHPFRLVIDEPALATLLDASVRR